MRSDYMTTKKDEIFRIFLRILIVVFILSFEGVVLTADAVDCGDSIGVGETVTLTGDLGPCSGRALTIEGPARLNLNGFTVNCGEGKDGIRVNGQKAIIQNGTVRDCDTAVDVRGNGYHQIVNLTVDNNEIGFRLRSGSSVNHLINNTATNNSDRGFRVDEGSDNNKLTNNFAEFSNKGFRIDGDNNNIVGNEANNNASENFQIKGNNNRLVNNTANGGPEECFLIDEIDEGVGGDENQLINNHATGCLDGFVFSAGAEGNSITNNRALGNGTDLIDDDCANNNNVWKNNKFETSAGTCIE
jgi:parallel beta-helix repeat protein